VKESGTNHGRYWEGCRKTKGGRGIRGKAAKRQKKKGDGRKKREHSPKLGRKGTNNESETNQEINHRRNEKRARHSYGKPKENAKIRWQRERNRMQAQRRIRETIW